MKAPKSLDLPPEVARAFVQAMRDLFAQTDKRKQDAIAVHTLHILKQYDPKLRLGDVESSSRR